MKTGKAANHTPLLARARDRAEFYHGLRQQADLGLHGQVEAVLSGLLASKGSSPIRVLDLGAGEGAFSQRLHHLGLKVTAADAARDPFKADGPTFCHVDFDDPESVDPFLDACAGKFDMIIAMEVIEHLRNPWQFMRLLRLLARDDTEILVTTPNVANWWGRIWFLLTGELWGFTKAGWDDPGHINPFTGDRFSCIARDAGMTIVSATPGGVMPLIWLYNWKRFLLSILALPLRPFQRGTLNGWVTIYHLRKAVGKG
jgi:SAM-dependent methyltransferase